MRTLITPLAIALTATSLASCGHCRCQIDGDAMTTDSLLYVAEVYVGDTVRLRGTAVRLSEPGYFAVTDSGRTCEIKVEYEGAADIDGGESVVVKGLLCEERTTKADIMAKAAEVDSLCAAGAVSDAVRQKTQNAIAAKKAYMEFTGRDYYSVFSISGAQVEEE